MKKALVILLVLVMMASLAACGGSTSTTAAPAATTAAMSETAAETTAGGNYEVAFIVKGLSDQFFTDSQIGAEAKADELGMQLSYLAPEGGQADIEGEVQIMEDSIIKGVNGIIIDCSDNAALNPTIVKANEEGIKVVLYNDIVDFDDLAALGGHIDSYVGLNSYDAAAMVGKYCMENSAPGKVAILEGMSGIVASTERVEGFKSALTGDYEVVASQPANWDMNEGYNVMQNMLTANPEITIVWAVSSRMAMGAIQAIEDMGLTGQIDVYDFDCTTDDIAAIKAGTLIATLRYPTKEWAALAVSTMNDLLDGKEVPEKVYTDVQVITAENADSVVF